MTGEELRAALGPIERFLPAISDAEAGALAEHLNLLLSWNRKMNLTRVSDPVEAARKHVGESLFLAERLESGARTVVDLGAGGGFPGIPVAIMRPLCQVTLVERDMRKSVFLREASRGLRNVSVVSRQFEEMPGRFDYLISRAVNLTLVKRGPEIGRAVVLGGASLGDKEGLVARFEWERTTPLPWETGGFLWTGVSRETHG